LKEFLEESKEIRVGVGRISRGNEENAHKRYKRPVLEETVLGKNTGDKPPVRGKPVRDVNSGATAGGRS